MSDADAALQYVMQATPPAHITKVRSLIDEWDNQNGIMMLTRCNRQLGVLLNFLGGEGEKKMHELLLKLDWPFKEHKIKATMQVLKDCMPYFEDSFATKLGVALPGTILVRDSVDGVLAIATKVLMLLIEACSWRLTPVLCLV